MDSRLCMPTSFVEQGEGQLAAVDKPQMEKDMTNPRKDVDNVGECKFPSRIREWRLTPEQRLNIRKAFREICAFLTIIETCLFLLVFCVLFGTQLSIHYGFRFLASKHSNVVFDEQDYGHNPPGVDDNRRRRRVQLLQPIEEEVPSPQNQIIKRLRTPGAA